MEPFKRSMYFRLTGEGGFSLLYFDFVKIHCCLIVVQSFSFELCTLPMPTCRTAFQSYSSWECFLDQEAKNFLIIKLKPSFLSVPVAPKIKWQNSWHRMLLSEISSVEENGGEKTPWWWLHNYPERVEWTGFFPASFVKTSQSLKNCQSLQPSARYGFCMCQSSQDGYIVVNTK